MQAKFEFKGTGGELFGSLLKGWLLTGVTFGIYLPWFMVEMIKLVFSKTKMRIGDEEVELRYTGTGGELFKKMLVGYLLTCVTFGIYFCWFLVELIKFHQGSMSAVRADGRAYRLNSQLTGGELFATVFVGYLLTCVTFGIYAPWFLCKVQKLLAEKTTIQSNGEVVGTVAFTGEGGALFKTFLVGYLLTCVTFGIYFFWFQVELFKFFTRSTEVRVGEVAYRGDFTGTGGESFKVNFLGYLFTMWTFGIYSFWYIANLLKFQLGNLTFGPSDGAGGDGERLVAAVAAPAAAAPVALGAAASPGMISARVSVPSFSEDPRDRRAAWARAFLPDEAPGAVAAEPVAALPAGAPVAALPAGAPVAALPAGAPVVAALPANMPPRPVDEPTEDRAVPPPVVPAQPPRSVLSPVEAHARPANGHAVHDLRADVAPAFAASQSQAPAARAAHAPVVPAPSYAQEPVAPEHSYADAPTYAPLPVAPAPSYAQVPAVHAPSYAPPVAPAPSYAQAPAANAPSHAHAAAPAAPSYAQAPVAHAPSYAQAPAAPAPSYAHAAADTNAPLARTPSVVPASSVSAPPSVARPPSNKPAPIVAAPPSTGRIASVAAPPASAPAANVAPAHVAADLVSPEHATIADIRPPISAAEVDINQTIVQSMIFPDLEDRTDRLSAADPLATLPDRSRRPN